MSSANAETLRKAFEAWNRRDLGNSLEFADPEIVLDLSRNIFNPDVYRGYEGVERLARVVDETWADFQQEVTELVEVGDRLVIKVRIAGRGRGGGVPVEMDLFNVWAFRGGRVLRVIGGIRTRADALNMAAAERLPEPVDRAGDA